MRRARTWADAKGVYLLIMRTVTFKDRERQAALEDQAAILALLQGAPRVLKTFAIEMDPLKSGTDGSRRGGRLRFVTECVSDLPSPTLTATAIADAVRAAVVRWAGAGQCAVAQGPLCGASAAL